MVHCVRSGLLRCGVAALYALTAILIAAAPANPRWMRSDIVALAALLPASTQLADCGTPGAPEDHADHCDACLTAAPAAILAAGTRLDLPAMVQAAAAPRPADLLIDRTSGRNGLSRAPPSGPRPLV